MPDQEAGKDEDPEAQKMRAWIAMPANGWDRMGAAGAARQRRAAARRAELLAEYLREARRGLT